MQNADTQVGNRRLRPAGTRVLLADDSPTVRSGLAALLREAEGVVDVVEAEDGTRAVEIAREMHFDLAVLDLNMPRLDGVQAARQLQAQQPSMRIALHSTDLDSLRVRAAGLGMPLFDKLESDTLLAWVERQARKPVSRSTPRSTLPRLELECMRCGYGIVSAAPPRECPMCHTVAAWTAPARTRHASHYDHAVRF